MADLFDQSTTKAWPQTLVNFIDVVENQLQRDGFTAEQARDIAQSAVMAMAEFAGGRQIYLPKGTRLQQALRDRTIYQKWRGNNMDTLIREFGLSQPQLYNIIAAQQKLHAKSLQDDLFTTPNAA